MRRAIGAIIVLTCLAILIHDAASGRMSVFCHLYNADDLAKPLCSAASRGDVEEVRMLLRRGADPDASFSGRTPLLWAVAFDHKAVVALLIAEGADAKTGADNGWTPLHDAVSGDRRDIVFMLLIAGADVNAMTTKMFIGGPLSIRGGPVPRGTEPWKFQDPRLREIQDLQDATSFGFTTGPGVPRNEGWSPLHEAALSGKAQIAELLLAKGAHVNAKDKHDETPLDIAQPRGHKAITALLRKHGGKTGEELR